MQNNINKLTYNITKKLIEHNKRNEQHMYIFVGIWLGTQN